jgi:hypothetical protein
MADYADTQIRYEVGYQLSDKCFSFTRMIADFPGRIDTVYFPWTDIATCRSPIADNRGYRNWMAQFSMERDLRWLRDKKIRLNLLLNANCYGDKAVSKYLENNIQSVIDHLNEVGLRPEIVTTASPAVARMVKMHYPGLLTRASVNMKIGTVEGMEYLSDYFDEYNMQRDYNRDFARIRQLKQWTEENGKDLFCSRTPAAFATVRRRFSRQPRCARCGGGERDNIEGWYLPNCRRYLGNQAHWATVLQPLGTAGGHPQLCSVFPGH